MAITPNTDLKLLKCPLELSDDNQLTFSNTTEQYNYFNGLTKIEEDKFSYQRKDSVIRFPAHIDSIIGYNYVMYRNTNYGSKWFYAFIENMEYLNDNVTLIKIKTDVWQTWQFDLNFGMSWIEREHTNDDSIGSNLIEENLDLGEYTINNSSDLTYVNSDVVTAPFVAIGVTQLFDDNFTGITMTSSWGLYELGVYDGLPSALYYIIVPANAYEIGKITKIYDSSSKADAIVNIFPIPYSYYSRNTDLFRDVTYTFNGSNETVKVIRSSQLAKLIGDITTYPTSSLNGYTPKNNKLLTYPYVYQRVTNNGGIDSIFHFEDFTNRQPTYHLYASLVQGMSIKLIPVNYLNTTGAEAYDYAISGQKLPTCAWSSDYYLNWVNQQGQNLIIQTGVNTTQTILGAIGSAVTGNIAGAISNLGSLASTVADSFQQVHEAELVPQQAKGNANTGDVNFSFRKSCFTFLTMSIKAQFAHSIDNYFSMFGYKTNRTKTPNIYGRRYWNYVKTISCNITGDVPESDIAEIKALFDKGITLWHNPSNFLNYNLTNSIV